MKKYLAPPLQGIFYCDRITEVCFSEILMKIHLYEHFTYKKIIKFTLPSIAMMIFTSIYGVVDGFFVSNFAGKEAFTAVNFIYPFIMVLGAFGFMFGTGGSALIAKTLGEGKKEKANRLFSMFVYISAAFGIVIAVAGVLLLRPIASALGAEGELLENCVTYGRILLIAMPAFMLQYEFQSFCATAEKPQLGLAVTIGAGVTNMVLDAVLVLLLPQELKLTGAALATALSQCVGGIVPLIYFAKKNDSLLKLTAFEFDVKSFFKGCGNGSSELMANISMSLVAMLYNAQLITHAGEDGVAAYGVLMYVNMIFLAIYIGYSVGSAPIIGYNFGADNKAELKSVLKKSLVIISVSSLLMLLAGILLANPLSDIFVGYDQGLWEMTVNAFFIFSFSFLFAGLAIFGSSFFTALNNGLVSAIMSFLRTMVFQIAAVILLPRLMGLDGIWLSVVVAEFMAALLSIGFIIAKRKKYGY